MMRAISSLRLRFPYLVRLFSPGALTARGPLVIDDFHCRAKHAGAALAQPRLAATWQVGLVSSSYFTGNLAGTLLAGVLIKRFGFTRSYPMACLLFALATAALGRVDGFPSELLLRFLAGVACALSWVVVESALMHSSTVHTRGQLLVAYMIIYYLGTVVGQLLLSGVATALTAVLPSAFAASAV